MSVKQCLTFGDHTKIKNAVDKNKPMSMTKQKMAEKQEKMFYGLSKDSGFQKEISGLNKMDKITAIQNKYAQNGVKITRQKINKMMKNGVTVVKPSISISQTTPPVVKISSAPKAILKTTPTFDPPLKKDAARFIDSKNQRKYDKYYNEFMQDRELSTIEQFRKKWEDAASYEMHHAVRDWKVSPNRDSAIGLKMKAEKLEMGNLKTIIKKGITKSKLKKIIDAERAIGDDAYIKMRALGQSYFDKTGIRKVTLYRGTDGKTGERLAKQVKEMQKIGKKTTIIRDNSLSGYSSAPKIADNFGAGRGGITIRTEFDSRDVILPYDLWPKAMHKSELEFICIGGDKTVSLKDISLEIGKWL